LIVVASTTLDASLLNACFYLGKSGFCTDEEFGKFETAAIRLSSVPLALVNRPLSCETGASDVVYLATLNWTL